MKKYGRANQSVSITVIKGIRIINKSNWTYSAMISSSSSSHGHGLRSQLTMLSTTRNPYSGGSLGEKMCRVFPRFQPKNSQKKTTCFFVGPPPSLIVVWRGFTRNPPPPLKDHAVCVPSPIVSRVFTHPTCIEWLWDTGVARGGRSVLCLGDGGGGVFPNDHQWLREARGLKRIPPLFTSFFKTYFLWNNATTSLSRHKK